MFSRREFLGRALAGMPGAAGAAALLAQHHGNAQGAGAGRVVILGFDGVEPSIVETMLSAGELPNLAKLRDGGCYRKLGSSNPPQSPTAWSSFATCTNPGNHGIFDFLRRNPQKYVPGLGFGNVRPAELDADGKLSKRAEFVSLRNGQTFWSVANAAGKKCKLLTVPYACPPEDLKESVVLAGLDTPDIRGTQSTYFSFSDQFAQVENVPGGVHLPLKFEGNAATVNVPGVRNPATKQFVEVPVTFTVDRAAHTITIDVQGKPVTVAQGQWTDWVEWSFAVTPSYSVQAVSRFYVMEAAEKVRLYMSCLQIHPKAPMLRISTPEDYSAKLVEQYGLYKTVGWAYDTKALQQDELTDDMFLEDERRTVDFYERLLVDELGAGNFDLVVAGWTFTDRVAHMFWRFRDPKHPLYTAEGAAKYGRAVEECYIRMDAIVGKAMEKLGPDDLLLVMSDHGFKSFRRAFSVNTWLVRNGYLAVRGQDDAAAAMTDEKFLQGFDWNRSRAYGLGLGSIYLNLEGREGEGIVGPDEADALLAEIKQKLLEVTDPETNEKIFSAVYLRSEAYKGAAEADAPDIQLGYADGYQTEKASAAGAAPKDVFSANDDKWSAEHAAADVAITPGILFANKALAENPWLVDLGVTALTRLNVPVPASFEGKSLL